MRKLVWIAAAAAGLFAIVPAAAQPRDVERKVDPQDIRRLHEFSACVADRRTDEAHRVLGLDFQSRDYSDGLRGLATRHRGCMASSRGARFNGVLFSGGLAEQLVERGLDGRGFALLGVADPALPPVIARNELEMMSLCTVRRAPVEVGALLAAAPTSAAETEALRALGPAVQNCLKAGQNARLSRSALRSLLALAAYRIHRHGAAAPTGG